MKKLQPPWSKAVFPMHSRPRADTLAAVGLRTSESTTSGLNLVGRARRKPSLGITWVHPELRVSALEGRRLILGRGTDCEMQLASQQVSRRHASAVLRGNDWFLVDEGSKNGLYIDGVRVTQGCLSPQTVVRLGDWVGVVTGFEAETGALEREPRTLAPGLYGGLALASAFHTLAAAAHSAISVVLVGETGTGKEVFARALHRLSGRTGRLVAVNCAAIPRELAESELFGYRKGSFTGAERHHEGYLRSAKGGTLFLDEVSDLEPLVQAKLLRALEEHSVVGIGETQPRAIDFRLVAASQQPLHEAVERGKFRADLMSRLNGLEVHLPPLRRRREEVLELFRLSLQEESQKHTPQISADLAERLCLYDWPLNVREVVQVARRASVLHAHVPVLHPEHLPPRVVVCSRECEDRVPNSSAPAASESERSTRQKQSPRSRAARRSVALRDKDGHDLARLKCLLDEFRGNVTQAAKEMGISRQRAYRLMDLRPDLDVQEWREKRGEAE